MKTILACMLILFLGYIFWCALLGIPLDAAFNDLWNYKGKLAPWMLGLVTVAIIGELLEHK